MSKKYLNIGLVISLLAIWGYVGMQFFEYSSGEDYVIPHHTTTVKLEDDVEQESYELLSIGKTDQPFDRVTTVRQRRKTSNINRQKVTRSKKQKIKEVPIIWPDVKYSGVMSHHGKLLALVHIGKADKMINEGDFFQGVQFTKIFEDSLQMIYQKEKKIIYK